MNMKEVSYNFSGKNYVVTGASSGIGRQIAAELAESGANVLAVARREQPLQALAETYKDRLMPGVADVSDIVRVEEAVGEFTRRYGKIHGCVYAAAFNAITSLKGFDESQARNIMEISFWSAVSVMRLLTKRKYANLGSSYVFLSSTNAYIAPRGMFAYSGAKAAIQVAMRSIAKEIADRSHRVNTISPGWIKNTEMTEGMKDLMCKETISQGYLLGLGEVEDVSGIALFLLSNRSKWITGTDVVVDGGYLA